MKNSMEGESEQFGLLMIRGTLLGTRDLTIVPISSHHLPIQTCDSVESGSFILFILTKMPSVQTAPQNGLQCPPKRW